MKRIVLGLLVLSLFPSCKKPLPPQRPYVNPNHCPQCKEKKTYEIINARLPMGPNRRCVKCGYTWYCENCWTTPFWRK